MGKSFIMRMFLKDQVESGIQKNFALLVPTKALINEVTSKIINDLKERHNFIFVLPCDTIQIPDQLWTAFHQYV